MRGGLGFNGPISGLHHPEYIWIASPGLFELCGNQPCCNGLEVKKCGCNVLLESIAFQECIQGAERSFQDCKERYGKRIVCIFSATLRKEDGQGIVDQIGTTCFSGAKKLQTTSFGHRWSIPGGEGRKELQSCTPRTSHWETIALICRESKGGKSNGLVWW